MPRPSEAAKLVARMYYREVMRLASEDHQQVFNPTQVVANKIHMMTPERVYMLVREAGGHIYTLRPRVEGIEASWKTDDIDESPFQAFETYNKA